MTEDEPEIPGTGVREVRVKCFMNGLHLRSVPLWPGCARRKCNRNKTEKRTETVEWIVGRIFLYIYLHKIAIVCSRTVFGSIAIFRK